MGRWFGFGSKQRQVASRHFYRTIVENAADCIYVREQAAPGRLIYVNDAFCRSTGYGRDQLLRMSILDLDVMKSSHEIDRLKDRLTGRATRFQTRYRHRDGSVVPVEISATKVEFEGKDYVLGYLRDISDRVRLGRQDVLRARFFELLVQRDRLEEILKVLVEYVECMRDGAVGSILLLDENGTTLRQGAAGVIPEFFLQAFDGMEVGPDAGPAGMALTTDQRVIIGDIKGYNGFGRFRQLCHQVGIKSCWCEPIRGENKKVLGVMTVYLRHKQEPTEDDLRSLETAAELASAAILRRLSDDELQMAFSVYEVSKEGILVADKDTRIIQVNPAFTTITGYRAEEVLGRNPNFLRSGRTQSNVFTDMWSQLAEKDHWQGEIINRRKNGEEYCQMLTICVIRDSHGQPLRYVGIFADITEWKQAQEVIVRQANFDPLTGLPNRRLFQDRLEHEMKKTDRDRGQLALMFIDLDHFKEVNDTMGHNAGDLLLIEASQRMSSCVRASDTVARLGGDEFAVILGTVPSAQLAERVATEILSALEAPFHVRGEVAHVSASLGITLYPVDAKDAQALMMNADQAMYAAKAQGRARFSWFTETMQHDAEKRILMTNDLRDALANDALQVYFQPIVDLQSGKVVKAEALIRWNHPTLGPIPPTQFVPVAEETGQIGQLGTLVFKRSAQVAKRWVDWALAHDQPELAKIIRISVNKSPRQFQIQSTYGNWVELLQEIGLHPSHMVIEITENLFLGDQVDIAAKLQRFRDVGMALSLDDFGTGYSSLGYLKKYEVDYLKMDQSFVRGMMEQASDRAIAEAILAMASRLGLDVVAEGIEYPEQRDFLTQAGCRYGQGYLFWRPMPEAEFLALVAPE